MAGRPSKKRQRGVAAQNITPRLAEMKEGILQIQSFLQEAGALAGAEVRRAEEIRRVLGEGAARLEAEAGEQEKTLRERRPAQEEMEAMAARITELERELASKEELLQRRPLELQDSQAKSQDTRTAVLQAQVKEQQEALKQKEVALKELQESYAARLRSLEEQVRKGAELLEKRDAEIGELHAKIDELHLSQEGGVDLAEENIVLLEELAQGPEVEPPAQSAPSAKGRMIGRSIREVMMQPGKTAGRETPSDTKRSRWATLMAPVKKGT